MKKKREACGAGSCAAWVARARACARMLARWSKAWLVLAWPAEFNLFFFFFLSFVQIDLVNTINLNKLCRTFNLPRMILGQ
jgi:hypothetical protein